MRNKKVITAFVSILTVFMMLMFTSTVFATGELGTLTPPPEDSEPTQVVIDDNQEETDAVEETEPTQDDEYYNENNGEYIEDVTEAPTYYDVYGDELPQVSTDEVTEPTTMAIPDVEVTDTSLIGGVIAWLCVAVGIAVVAGVLVSQRTRQVTSNSSSRDSRRR